MTWHIDFLWRNSFVGRLFDTYLRRANALWFGFLDKTHFSIQWNGFLETCLLLFLVFMPVLSLRTEGESWRLLIPLILLLWMVNSTQNKTQQAYHTGFAFLWLILTVSAFFNSGFANGSTALFRFGFWFILAWLAGRVLTGENCEKILKYLTYSSVIWLIIGFRQLFSGMVTPRGWLGPGQVDIIPVRIYSIFGNPNIYALYLLGILVFSHYLIAKSTLKIERSVLSGVFLAVLASLYFTYSRMAWIIVGIYLALKFKNRWRYSLPIAGVGLIILILIPGFQVRMGGLVNLSDSSFWYRIQIWQGVWKALQDFWVWGAGPGSFQMIYPQYRIGRTISQHAHNLYLQFWLEHGIISLLALFTVLKRILTGYRFQMNALNPLIIVLIIFLVYGLTETWYVHSFCGGYFWFLCGLSLSMRKYSNEPGKFSG